MNNFTKISNYYNDLVNKYGHNPKSCDYGQANSQRIKFEVLSAALSYSNKTVLDIGCGFADYAVFLKNKFENINYTGVDISEQMINHAKKIHPKLDLELKNVFLTPPTQKYDVVTTNGIFYLLGENAQSLMYDFITKMYSYSNEVVVFNSLSSWTKQEDQEDGEFYADPLETLAFCKEITPWVTLRHDYHTRDFTIYMYKKNQSYDSFH